MTGRDGAALPRLGWRATFDEGRIGSHGRDVKPLTVWSEDADYIARVIHGYARRFLSSRGIEVHVELDGANGVGDGVVFAGPRVVARFELEQVAEYAGEGVMDRGRAEPTDTG